MKDTLAIKVCWNVKTSLTTAYLTKFDLLFNKIFNLRSTLANNCEYLKITKL